VFPKLVAVAAVVAAVAEDVSEDVGEDVAAGLRADAKSTFVVTPPAAPSNRVAWRALSTRLMSCLLDLLEKRPTEAADLFTVAGELNVAEAGLFEAGGVDSEGVAGIELMTVWSDKVVSPVAPPVAAPVAAPPVAAGEEGGAGEAVKGEDRPSPLLELLLYAEDKSRSRLGGRRPRDGGGGRRRFWSACLCSKTD